MAERTYSEDEMTAMLELASKLQAKAAKNAESRAGLTLPELETIAAEAGLDPIHLRQAATQLFNQKMAISHGKSSTSASHNYVDQWVVAELNDESWEEVVSELRHRYDSDLGYMMGASMEGSSAGVQGYGRGVESSVGRSRQWKHMSMSGIETRVIVQPRGESLQVKLSQRVGWGGTTAESVTYGLILALLGAGIAGAVGEAILPAILTFIAAMAVFVPLIAYADKAWRKKKHRELEELGNRLGQILAIHQPVKEPDMTYEDAGSSRIDASLLDQEDAYTSEESSQKERLKDR